MEAIIETGGKQYRVKEGDLILVEKLAASEGEAVLFDRVLTVKKEEELHVGSPYVAGAKVSGKILEQDKARKIVVFKYKAKKNYRRKQGHRQPYSKVVIEKIEY